MILYKNDRNVRFVLFTKTSIQCEVLMDKLVSFTIFNVHCIIPDALQWFFSNVRKKEILSPQSD